MLLSNYIHQGLGILKTFKHFEPTQKKLIHKISFYSQQDTGINTRYTNWLWKTNGCGMACLKMILNHSQNKKPLLYKLGERCKEYSGFLDNPSNPDKLDGLFYQPFIRFIKAEFNLEGKIASPLLIEEIVENLEKGDYVITSVSSEIRDPKTHATRKGGHLVLVVGYDWLSKKLYINNPSFPKVTKMPMDISFKDFSKFFANRGIIINKNESSKSLK